ncbi:hypothetical protein FHS27_000075 [Rhodopirellula rubra]|uniref:Uncharacterized protein n=1 Tax=Aporhodopirellula rubra TaxID=980271 RepID=A0A7W5DTM1_9BACT|nr:hypothetical protein [Aporhodopirellula rubra]
MNERLESGGWVSFVWFACFVVADRCCFASGRTRSVRCHVGKSVSSQKMLVLILPPWDSLRGSDGGCVFLPRNERKTRKWWVVFFRLVRVFRGWLKSEFNSSSGSVVRRNVRVSVASQDRASTSGSWHEAHASHPHRTGWAAMGVGMVGTPQRLSCLVVMWVSCSEARVQSLHRVMRSGCWRSVVASSWSPSCSPVRRSVALAPCGARLLGRISCGSSVRSYRDCGSVRSLRMRLDGRACRTRCPLNKLGGGR